MGRAIYRHLDVRHLWSCRGRSRTFGRDVPSCSDVTFQHRRQRLAVQYRELTRELEQPFWTWARRRRLQCREKRQKEETAMSARVPIANKVEISHTGPMRDRGGKIVHPGRCGAEGTPDEESHARTRRVARLLTLSTFAHPLLRLTVAFTYVCALFYSLNQGLTSLRNACPIGIPARLTGITCSAACRVPLVYPPPRLGELRRADFFSESQILLD